MNLTHTSLWRRGFAFAALTLVTLHVAGCGPAKTEKTTAAPDAKTAAPVAVTKAAPPQATENEADMLAALAENAAPLTEGDKAWREVQQAMRPPGYPPEWREKEPTKEEVAAFEQKNGEMAGAAADKLKDFYTRFPKHDHAEDARKQEQGLLNAAVQLGATNRLARLQELEAERLKDPNLPEDDRLELRVQQLQRAAFQKKGDGISAALTEMERGVRVLQKEFPKRAEIGALLLSVAQGWADEGNAEKGRALAGELADGSTDEETKESAKALVKKLDRVGKPLALKFAAMDGREVDLQKLKGKVVLVDFWATWCGPCIKELPAVKAAYEKLNAKGFEIVGISFDQDKAALEKLVAKEKMPWPQYFEGGEKGNKFGEEFNISGIPTMWLVDKQGVLRDLNGREKLTEKVEKLLAEK